MATAYLAFLAVHNTPFPSMLTNVHSSQTEALNEFNATMETQQQLIIKDSLSVSNFAIIYGCS